MVTCLQDVINIYNKKPQYSASATIKTKNDSCQQDICVKAEIKIFANGILITFVCERSYHTNAELVKFCEQTNERIYGQYGKVTKHIMIGILDDALGQGHMKRIHDMEIMAYKDHEIRQIQIDRAVSSGTFLWAYFGFEFVDSIQRHNLTVTYFRSFLVDELDYSETEAEGIANDCCGRAECTQDIFKAMKPYCVKEIYCTKDDCTEKIYYTKYLSKFDWLDCVALYKDVVIS
jgi:hypothetical protein